MARQIVHMIQVDGDQARMGHQRLFSSFGEFPREGHVIKVLRFKSPDLGAVGHGPNGQGLGLVAFPLNIKIDLLKGDGLVRLGIAHRSPEEAKPAGPLQGFNPQPRATGVKGGKSCLFNHGAWFQGWNQQLLKYCVRNGRSIVFRHQRYGKRAAR